MTPHFYIRSRRLAGLSIYRTHAMPTHVALNANQPAHLERDLSLSPSRDDDGTACMGCQDEHVNGRTNRCRLKPLPPVVRVHGAKIGSGDKRSERPRQPSRADLTISRAHSSQSSSGVHVLIPLPRLDSCDK